MSTLKELRRRLQVTQSMEKITTAMKLVASAKLKRIQNQLHNARDYNNKFTKIYEETASYQTLSVVPVTFIIVCLGSERGLCGGYNTMMARTVERHYEKLVQQGGTGVIAPLGHKIKGLLKQYPLLQDITPETLGDRLKTLLDNQEFNTVYIVSGSFKNVMSQPIVVRPIITPPVLNKKNNDSRETLFEPCQPHCFDQIRDHYLATQIKTWGLENDACEYGARMTAMDSAARNAKEMKKKLTLLYNRARQEIITNELIEVISGCSN